MNNDRSANDSARGVTRRERKYNYSCKPLQDKHISGILLNAFFKHKGLELDTLLHITFDQ